MMPKYLIITVVAVIIISFFNLTAGILAIAAFIAIFVIFSFISRFPSDYDDKEQLETEDEINLIYEY